MVLAGRRVVIGRRLPDVITFLASKDHPQNALGVHLHVELGYVPEIFGHPRGLIYGGFGMWPMPLPWRRVQDEVHGVDDHQGCLGRALHKWVEANYSRSSHDWASPLFLAVFAQPLRMGAASVLALCRHFRCVSAGHDDHAAIWVRV